MGYLAMKTTHFLKTFTLLWIAIHIGPSREAFKQTTSVVTVTKGSRVMLNCSLDLPELQRYSLYWDISNKTGHQIKSLHFPQDTPIQGNFVGLPLVIEEAKIVDNGVYNCSVSRIIPPPSKRFCGPLIQLIVQAPPKMLVNYFQNGKYGVTVVCSLFEFYPEDVRVELDMTCGDVLKAVKNFSLVRNADGSFDATDIFWVNNSSCSNNASVTCEAHHVTGVVKHSTNLISDTWQHYPMSTCKGFSLTTILIIRCSLMIFVFIIFVAAITFSFNHRTDHRQE